MKTVLSSLEGVPEVLVPEYQLENGKYVLKLEGDIPAVVAANVKVNEFRDNNVKLLKEVEELRPKAAAAAKFDGIDPDAAKAAIAKVKLFGDKGIADAADVEARIASKVEELILPLKEKVQASEANALAERARANDFLLQTTLTDVFVKAGGKPNAADFVTNMGKGLFEVKDNKVVAKTGVFSKEKAGEPLTPLEWVTGSVAKDHDYVFQPSGGGNANPQRNGPTNPQRKVEGVKVITDPTPQEVGQYAADVLAGKVRFEHSGDKKAS